MQTPHTLVYGKATLADPKISPDGKYVSFIRDHNLWLVNVSDNQERAITRGGSEEIRKGELDWVYPEELDIKTAYWWAPDSSAIAYMEMDERKVAQYPLVDFASYSGEADMERYPPAGGANPVVRIFVAPVSGAEAEANGYRLRKRHLYSARELAAGLEAPRHSAPQSRADCSGFHDCRRRDGEFAAWPSRKKISTG